MIYTSGTTGRPKGVRRARPERLDAALEQFRAGARALGLDGSGPHLVTGPIYHAAPGMLAIYDQMNGAPLVIMPRWDEREALALLATREIAHTHLVPTMFVRLLRLPEAERAAFRAPKLDLVLHGAAPISPAVKRQMIEWWGPVLVEYWGGTESGVITCIGSQEWLAHPGDGRARAAGLRGVRGGRRRAPPAARRDRHALRAPRAHAEDVRVPRGPREDGFLVPRRRGRLHARRHRPRRHPWLRRARRPQRAHHHLGRREHLPGRDRGRAPGAPRGGRRRRLRHPGRRVGRAGEGRRRAGEGTGALPCAGGRAARLRARAARRPTRSRARSTSKTRFRVTRPGKLYVRRLRDRYWRGRERKI